MFFEWFDGEKEFVDSARRQILASEGARIQWYFAEKESMDVVQRLFDKEGIDWIELIFEPAK